MVMRTTRLLHRWPCFYGAWVGAVALGVALVTGAGGCSPDAAATNKPSPEDQFPPNKVLTPGEQASVEADMRSTTTGYQPRPLVKAPEGTRWEDVPGAIRAAAGACFLGVADVKQADDQVDATLVMPDGQRGKATVTRTAAGIQAQVTLGAFGRADEEAAFLKKFDRALKSLGQQRRPQA